jgi:hypothetical protein
LQKRATQCIQSSDSGSSFFFFLSFFSFLSFFFSFSSAFLSFFLSFLSFLSFFLVFSSSSDFSSSDSTAAFLDFPFFSTFSSTFLESPLVAGVFVTPSFLATSEIVVGLSGAPKRSFHASGVYSLVLPYLSSLPSVLRLAFF